MLRMPPVPWRNSVWLDAISLWIRYFLISLKGLLSSSPKRKVKVGDQREQRRLHRIIILNQTKKLFFLIMSSILKQMIMSLILIILLFPFSTCLDTLTLDQSIKDDQSLISKENNFALGFFSPGNSSYRYLGIWHVKVTKQTVVWVANRNDPNGTQTRQ